LERAKKDINLAKQEYSNTLLYDDIGSIRYASCGLLYNLIHALVNMNNTYIKRGVKRYREDLNKLKYLPENFDKNYMSVINADTVDGIRESSLVFLKTVIRLFNEMYDKYVDKPTPSKDNATATYEELWCNCRNKVIASCDSGDVSYAYHAAMGAQSYLDEMTEMIGTKKFDLMKDFDAKNLSAFKDAFLHAMDEYLKIYEKINLSPKIFKTFEEVYEQYMKER